MLSLGGLHLVWKLPVVTHGLCIRSCFMSNMQSVCVGYFKVRERVVSAADGMPNV